MLLVMFAGAPTVPRNGNQMLTRMTTIVRELVSMSAAIPKVVQQEGWFLTLSRFDIPK